jgi:hypothetical protein
LVAFLLGGAGGLALGAGSLISFMSEIVLGSERRTFLSTLSHRLLRGLPAISLVLGIVAGSTLLVWPGVVEYVSTRHVSLHWSRVIVAAFGFLSAFQIALTALLLRITSLWLDFAVDRNTDEPDWSQPVRADP